MNNSSIKLDIKVLTVQAFNDVSDRQAMVLLPCMIFVAILMMLGIPGNLLVCWFYGYKKKSTAMNVFMVTLAMFDLVACFISMPGEVVDMRYPYTFENVSLCKLFRYVNHFTAAGSILTLVVIAIDRHRRVCKTLKVQLTVFRAKIVSGLVLVLAVALSVPGYIMFTVVSLEFQVSKSENITGWDCTTSKDHTALNLAYTVFMFCCFIVSFSTLTILYTAIGKQILRQRKFRESFVKKSSSEKETRKPNTVPLTSTKLNEGKSDRLSIDVSSQLGPKITESQSGDNSISFHGLKLFN